MKTRKLLSLILALLMALCLVPAAVFAEGEQVIDVTDRNVIKVTTAADFAAGTLEGLVPTSVGNGALALAEGATEGTFTSAVYTIADFYKMVGAWNAAIYDGTSVEIEARDEDEAQEIAASQFEDVDYTMVQVCCAGY